MEENSVGSFAALPLQFTTIYRPPDRQPIDRIPAHTLPANTDGGWLDEWMLRARHKERTMELVVVAAVVVDFVSQGKEIIIVLSLPVSLAGRTKYKCLSLPLSPSESGGECSSQDDIPLRLPSPLYYMLPLET